MKELRRIFLVGIFAVAPLGLTLYLLVKLFSWFDDLFQPLIQPLSRNYFQTSIPGLGVLVGLLAIFLVGLLAPSLLGKQFIFLAERVLDRLPLARWIYSGTKQIFDSFHQGNLTKFNRVVMVKFPQTNTYTLGFVTQEIAAKSGKLLTVFVPTTPNPTSGYVLFVAEKDSIPMSMSVEEALKFIISVGLVKPPDFDQLQIPL